MSGGTGTGGASALIALSTRLRPTKQFTVDGEPYELLTLHHIGKAEEARVQAYFARFSVLARKLSLANSDKEAEAFAERLRSTRIRILTALTTMPETLADRLPLPEQARLLEVVQRVYEGAEDDDDGESSEPRGDDDPIFGDEDDQ